MVAVENPTQIYWLSLATAGWLAQLLAAGAGWQVCSLDVFLSAEGNYTVPYEFHRTTLSRRNGFEEHN